jgi:hypothetical protein
LRGNGTDEAFHVILDPQQKFVLRSGLFQVGCDYILKEFFFKNKFVVKKMHTATKKLLFVFLYIPNIKILFISKPNYFYKIL